MATDKSILILLIFVYIQSALSWKKEEFRSCNEASFCKHARSRKPGECSLVANEVVISDGDVVAKLFPKTRLDSDQNDQANPLVLTLTAYRDGIIRLKVDEDPSSEKSKRRFQVPNVIVPEVENSKLWLRSLSRETIDGERVASVVWLSEGHEFVIQHDPFEVFAREKSTNHRVISLNSHGMFDFEQLGVKKEDDDWEEKFRSHIDKRPFGPQSISFDLSFYNADFVYGIPEHATSLVLKPTRGPGIRDSEPYRLFNLDVFEYLHDSPFGLYGSIPFMMSHGKTGRSSGFFWLNAAEMQIDVLGEGWDAESDISLPSAQSRVDTFWMSEAGIVDVFFFLGPDPKDVVRQYTSVTGRPAMPQLFATAYHQCRWNYRDEDDVGSVDSKFDEHDIPYDVLWLDIEHTDGKRYFTWDSVSFPNPEKMQNNLGSKGRHMVTIVDPHIKRDEGFWLHKQAMENGYYIKDSSGGDFDGWCWPGSSSYLDVSNPEIRSWWGDMFSYESYKGSTPWLYIWNDMNEPSVFNAPELTMPRDAVHHGGIEHREMHNAYGYYFHMATSDGLVRRGNGKDRPFVLSRAFFAGSQRYGAVWTGDNTADWDHLRVSIPMLLTLGLSGMSFSGADVGGFFGDPEPELLVRWYQIGAYYPFFRAHAHLDTKRREPWLAGKRNAKLIRDAIHGRYMLLPYFYTLFRESNVSGIPVLRSLWMEFPLDQHTFAIDEAFMVGNTLLVQGIFARRADNTSAYLPGRESWYDVRTGIAYAGGERHVLSVVEESIPVFQRAGTILPRRDRFRRSTAQMENDPYTLVIALNSSGAAEGELYADDGRSFEFLQGGYFHRRFVFSNGVLSSSSFGPDNNGGSQFSSACVIERIILLGFSSRPNSALVEPENRKVEIELGPLHHLGGSPSSFLTIRKPNVRIADDWTIRILKTR